MNRHWFCQVDASNHDGHYRMSFFESSNGQHGAHLFRFRPGLHHHKTISRAEFFKSVKTCCREMALEGKPRLVWREQIIEHGMLCARYQHIDEFAISESMYDALDLEATLGLRAALSAEALPPKVILLADILPFVLADIPARAEPERRAA